MLAAGKMKGIAFIKDPDGYWIEIFDLRRIGTVSTTAAWENETRISGKLLAFFYSYFLLNLDLLIHQKV